MSEIDFGDNSDEALAVTKSFIQRINGDFYGNGRKGVMDEMHEFVASFKATEVERERQHSANINRLNVIIGLLIAIAAYIAIMVSVKGLPKTSDIFHSQSETLAQQTAHMPDVR